MDQIKSNLKQAKYILRYLRNEITPTEKLELEIWVQKSEENRKIFEEAVNESLRKEHIKMLEKVNVAKGWDELLLKVNNKEKIIPFNNHKRWWYAVAAAVIIMGVFSLYKFNDQNKKIENSIVVNPIPAKDIVPGSNKAILQLADGSTIILDSSNNGNIASQGQTKIIKIDGQLAYNADGSSKEVLYNTISTPRGGQYQLILADGTKVWLNAASSLKFTTNFVGDKRRVALTGEAYFEVAKNAKMPFVVTIAGKEEVEVLGTHFNINAYPDEPFVNTTLLEGKVKVVPAIIHNKNAQPVILIPGEQARLAPTGSITNIKDADIEKVIAWKNNVFNFNNENIESIMRQISRWYDVEISFEGQIPDVKFSGEIGRSLSLKQVLSILDETRIKYKISGNKLIIGNSK